MRVVALSDLHIAKEGYEESIERIRETLSTIEADVLYFGGDLSESNHNDPVESFHNFEEGLEVLASSPAKKKLFVAGNNDLESLQLAPIGGHYTEIANRIRHYGFELLDNTPVIIDNIGFLGNIGWYDGSLWKKFKGKTQ
jgi:predicted phosphodiesterase